jgi:hypothetical protein
MQRQQQQQQQIPFGDDNKKGKATTTAMQRQQQQQIPFGDDNKKGKATTTATAAATADPFGDDDKKGNGRERAREGRSRFLRCVAHNFLRCVAHNFSPLRRSQWRERLRSKYGFGVWFGLGRWREKTTADAA